MTHRPLPSLLFVLVLVLVGCASPGSGGGDPERTPAIQGPAFVPADNLASYDGRHGIPVLTSVSLLHVAPGQVMARLRDLAPESVRLASISDAVLIQGPLADVRSMHAEIRRLDVQR